MVKLLNNAILDFNREPISPMSRSNSLNLKEEVWESPPRRVLKVNLDDAFLKGKAGLHC